MYLIHCLLIPTCLTPSWCYPFRLWLMLFALTSRTHPKAPTMSIFLFYSLHRYVLAQTWTPMDGWYLEDSQGWFGSIFSMDSPLHWAIVCNLKAELTSMLCSNHPPLLKSLTSLQPVIAFCPVPSCDPHGTLGMKSAKNKWPPCTGHRNWSLSGQ